MKVAICCGEGEMNEREECGEEGVKDGNRFFGLRCDIR